MSTTLAAGYWDVGLKEYHADRECISSTVLEIFRESPQEYHAIYIAGMRKPKPPSWEMRIGTALHAAVLEPEKCNDLVIVEPDWNNRTKDGRAERDAFREAHSDKTIISVDDLALINHMKSSLMVSPISGPLIWESPGVNEQAVRWLEGDVWCKCCFDRLLKCGIDINLKTTRDPNPEWWAKHALDLGYHRQTALYRMGKRQISKAESLHIVVGTEWPHRVGVFYLGERELRLGHQEVADLLDMLSFRRESNNWLERWQEEITEINFPRYAFRRK